MCVNNFLQVNDFVATSGQPTSEQIRYIAQQGYKYIINLAMPNSDNAISNEGQLVAQQGMVYVHIPVVWESPKIEQFDFFGDTLHSLKGQKVWVHCALNMRVSSFMFMYQVLCENELHEVARSRLEKVWKPNGIWQSYIDRVISLRA